MPNESTSSELLDAEVMVYQTNVPWKLLSTSGSVHAEVWATYNSSDEEYTDLKMEITTTLSGKRFRWSFEIPEDGLVRHEFNLIPHVDENKRGIKLQFTLNKIHRGLGHASFHMQIKLFALHSTQKLFDSDIDFVVHEAEETNNLATPIESVGDIDNVLKLVDSDLYGERLWLAYSETNGKGNQLGSCYAPDCTSSCDACSKKGTSSGSVVPYYYDGHNWYNYTPVNCKSCSK